MEREDFMKSATERCVPSCSWLLGFAATRSRLLNPEPFAPCSCQAAPLPQLIHHSVPALIRRPRPPRHHALLSAMPTPPPSCPPSPAHQPSSSIRLVCELSFCSTCLSSLTSRTLTAALPDHLPTEQGTGARTAAGALVTEMGPPCLELMSLGF